jgi:hypothetical protein
VVIAHEAEDREDGGSGDGAHVNPGVQTDVRRAMEF